MGPPGGDVRSLATDAKNARRVYLGTTDGHVFGSRDAGERWELLGRAGNRGDSVVAAILVDRRDAQTLFAATWTQDPAAGGGVFRSNDSGRTWHPVGLEGEAVRALAQAQSNPDVLVAGTMGGVYRSSDRGKTWHRISPDRGTEIRNLDSVAIEPHNPDVIYAGTFHLPWKTTDGGRTWFPIHTGMVDDSDVMSIVIDRTDPRRVYAGTCTGIYRSENGGGLWRKIHSIPFSAHRTHAIQQDASHPATLYAATPEGVWKTTNAGAAWRRVTPRHWAINALAISGNIPNRVFIGTEKLGILVSHGGEHFRAVNEGFFHRQITALALDPARPGRLLAVLPNGPQQVLATEDEGRTWKPVGPGLQAGEIRRVYASPVGWWASLERGGLMRYAESQRRWVPEGMVVKEAVNGPPRERTAARQRLGQQPLERVVNDMAFTQHTWFAATEDGLLASRDAGATWFIVAIRPMTTLPVRCVRASADGKHLWLVSLRGMVFSHDSGRTWSWHDLPLEAGGAMRLDVASSAAGAKHDPTLFASARNGLYISRDAGRSWQQASAGLPAGPIQDLAVVGPTVFASMQSGGLYASYDKGRTWARLGGTFADGFFPVLAALDSSMVLAASATEGLYAVAFVPAAAPVVGNGPIP